jgi:peptide/nickel transport system permease protein
LAVARYLVARLATSAAVFFAITLFVFVTFFALPSSSGGRFGSVREPYRTGSLPHGYAQYVWKLVRHGDLGRSYADREPVRTRLFRAVPVTLSLVLGGLVAWLLIAIPLGCLSALRPRSLLDRAVTIFVLVGISVHPLWLGLVFGYLFHQHWNLFPSNGYCDLFSPSTNCGGPVQWGNHMMLPWLVFGVLNAAVYTIMFRAFLLEELGHDYVRTARAKGAGEARVVRAHVLKNMLPPFVTMMGMTTGIALGGVIFVESAFGLPGLGGMLRQSIIRHDLPLTAGIVLFMAFAIVLLNLLVDLAYAAFDPRVRLSRFSLQRA